LQFHLNETGLLSAIGGSYNISSTGFEGEMGFGRPEFVLSMGFDLQNITRNNVTFELWHLGLLCQGFGGGDTANISNIGVACGFVMYQTVKNSLM
jgi:hypothetical protein